MDRFKKTVNDWIPLTIFAKSFILDVWMSSKYVSNYQRVSSVIINWGCHFESSKNLFNVISNLFKYIEQNFIFSFKKSMLETY